MIRIGYDLMTTVIIAEKPSVARDIARVLGATQSQDGYLEGAGYRVTWAIGHLVALPEPHEVRAEWKRWSWAHLPMLPDTWPLKVLNRTKSQFGVVKRLLGDRGTKQVIAATDAGREGELIFRYLYEKAGARAPVKRLWISSLTPAAIRQGFARLRDGEDFDPLSDAAKGRSRADWLVGMNLSRAYSLAHGETLTVGRVQTPTLAMLVEREEAIRSFVPEDYLEVHATFEAPEGAYDGIWFRDRTPAEKKAEGESGPMSRLPADGVEAQAILTRAEAARGRPDGAKVVHSDSETRTMQPPLLYDLTELQRHANRIYGFSAKKTLELAQALYERHKVLSYPRTSSRHLSTEAAGELPAVVAAMSGPYTDRLAPGTGVEPLGRRYVNDAEVGDHHAIIPTTTAPALDRFSPDEARIYDLVCRRLLQAWHDEHRWRVTTVHTAIETGTVVDRFRTAGRAVEQVGWKVLDPPTRKGAAADVLLPAGLDRGVEVAVTGAKVDNKQTRPPRPHSDATLLGAMEAAGRAVEDRALSRAMRECGLGTPATRAAIIETLIQREYVVRERKALRATDKGIRLVGLVHPEVKSPALTGDWEQRLGKIAGGQGALPTFMRDIEAFVRRLVGEVADTPPGRALGTDPKAPDGRSRHVEAPDGRSRRVKASDGRSRHVEASSPPASPARPPRSGDLKEILRGTFGFESFRPNQEAVCRAVEGGQTSLLVMPTGAGKSLCYQLPGLARGGTTVVISPLIALMEDQVAKLRALGLAAERIHSGRSREDSREVCRAYLRGDLEFLFIAPERLGVPGFPEMLGRRPPTLIAVDEAHCISHWGHDFRPDYRMLKERLPRLGSAPVVALTATATPRVQDDIMRQLAVPGSRRFIHGFRRTNIAVEVVEVPVPNRPDKVRAILTDPARRPAIVYAPTRKDAEALTDMLGEDMHAVLYHAGLGAEARDRAQDAFLSGRADVVVATIAFGMGIDKADVRTVIHTALPGSVEGYYQEIGRAGRDGAPSRAVLLHSFADRRTHEFFFDRDHPDPSLLDQIVRAVGRSGLAREDLQDRLSMDPNTLEKALEKLWIHGGVSMDPEGRIQAADPQWRGRYEAHRAHKLDQLERMASFAQSTACRMLQLVRHFGDEADDGAACGQCDACAPDEVMAQSFRGPDEAELAVLGQILDALVQRDGQAAGRLFGGVSGRVERRAFEDLLRALQRADLVIVEDHSFEKDGQTIAFRRVRITAAGHRTSRSTAALAQAVRVCEQEAKRPAKGGRRRARGKTAFEATPASAQLLAALKAWRLDEAKRRRVPAFRVLTDRVLEQVAARTPASEEELLAVPGFGPKLLAKYGAQVLGQVRAG